MRRTGKQIGCLLVAATLAFPAGASGQSAGDEQYEDPFAPEEQTGGGQPEPAPAQPAPEPGPEPAPAAPAPPSAAAAQSPPPAGAGELAYTGGEAGPLALAGAALVLSGLALRRRTGPGADRA